MDVWRLQVANAHLQDQLYDGCLQVTNAHLQDQLYDGCLQVTNAHLQDQLYAAQQQLKQKQQPDFVDVKALKKRLEDVTKALVAYRVTHCYIITSI